MFQRHPTHTARAIHPNEGYRPIVPDPMIGAAGVSGLPGMVAYESYLGSETLLADDQAEAGVKWLNRLLRGEIAAIETYEIALKDESLHNAEARTLLSQNLMEHREARTNLEKLVFKWRGEPDTSSGLWGSFTDTLTAAAKALSTKLAIETLIRGEEHGRSDYEDMLEEMRPESELANFCRDMIRGQERHLRRLELAKRSLNENDDTVIVH